MTQAAFARSHSLSQEIMRELQCLVSLSAQSRLEMENPVANQATHQPQPKTPTASSCCEEAGLRHPVEVG
jgi:hypothetical protein